MCLTAYMYVDALTHIHIYIYMFTYTCIHVYMYLFISIWICLHIMHIQTIPLQFYHYPVNPIVFLSIQTLPQQSHICYCLCFQKYVSPYFQYLCIYRYIIWDMCICVIHTHMKFSIYVLEYIYIYILVYLGLFSWGFVL